MVMEAVPKEVTKMFAIEQMKDLIKKLEDDDIEVDMVSIADPREKEASMFDDVGRRDMPRRFPKNVLEFTLRYNFYKKKTNEEYRCKACLRKDKNKIYPICENIVDNRCLNFINSEY